MHTIINSVTDRENNLEIITTNIIKQLGIPANLKGYRYLRYALMLCVENSEMITSVTKLLYPAISFFTDILMKGRKEGHRALDDKDTLFRAEI